MSQQSFADLGLSADVVSALAKRGIESPFPVQTKAIPAGLAGQDVLAKAPTGSGKTLAFAVPIVERLTPESPRPAALVLVPTRELAVQVTEELESLAKSRRLRIASVYGGVPIPAQAERAKNAHVIVATPGRLQDLVDRRLFRLDAVSILVLDEADRMLDMGFKPQVDKIVRLIPEKRQTMFFSATLDGAVGELARAYTHLPARISAELSEEQSPGEIDHHFVAVTAENKVEKLVELLNAERGLVLVFVRTKRGADRLAQKLERFDIHAAAMHGDKTQAAREKALSRFEAGKCKTLIATDVAARGLDLSDITHVINFDPPEDDKGYIHRVGRTGRAGKNGIGITLVLPDQQADVSRVARLNGHQEKFEETGMRTAPPKLVYSGRGRGSKWGPTRARRKI